MDLTRKENPIFRKIMDNYALDAEKSAEETNAEISNTRHVLSTQSKNLLSTDPSKPDGPSLEIPKVIQQSMDGTLPNTKPALNLKKGGDFVSSLVKAESSVPGDPYKAESGTGAYGKYQMVKGTAQPFLAKMGKTWNDFKADPKVQDAVFAQHEKHLESRLKKFNLPVTPLNKWYVHNLGDTGGIKAAKGKSVSTKSLARNLPKGIKPTMENYRKYWAQKFSAS